jgi:hypothetical protein
VRFLQSRRELDLARETLGTHGGRQRGRQHFDDDIAAQRFIACDEDVRHTRAAKLALDCVGLT